VVTPCDTISVTDIMKYVHRGNLPGYVSDILPAGMPRAVVIKHPCWWLGGGTGVDSDLLCSVNFRFKRAENTRFYRLLALSQNCFMSVRMYQLGSKCKDLITFGVWLIHCG